MGNELCSTAKEFDGPAFEVVLKNTAGHGGAPVENEKTKQLQHRSLETERERFQWRRDRLERNAQAQTAASAITAQTAASAITAFAKVDSENCEPGGRGGATAVHAAPPEMVYSESNLEAPKLLVGDQEARSKLLANALSAAAAAEQAAKEAKANLKWLDGTNDRNKRVFDAAIKAVEEARSPPEAAQAFKDFKVCAEKP